jgi:hypothetical protein
MPDEPRPMQKRPRWTRDRIVATAIHSVVGFFVGVGFTPTVLVLSLAFYRILGEPVYLAGALIGSLVVAEGSRNSCKQHPTAPLGIAVGVAIGGLMPLITLMIDPAGIRPGRLLITSAFLLVTGQAAGAYYGGMAALKKKLGQLQHGVGRTCAACGYDLSATPENWPCPECGGEMRYALRPGEFVQ